jgi:hypothetical protein
MTIAKCMITISKKVYDKPKSIMTKARMLARLAGFYTSYLIPINYYPIPEYQLPNPHRIKIL